MKILLTLLFLLTTLYAKTTTIDYTATFGIFGTVAQLNNSITKKGKHYTIQTKIIPRGIAKVMLNNHHEVHTSKGYMHNGFFVSNSFKSVRTSDERKEVKRYTIDHRAKRATRNIKRYNKEGKLTKNETITLNYYAQEDPLTLYFNMDRLIKQKGVRYRRRVVGLEKQNGFVNVTVPSEKQDKTYKDDLGDTANWYAKAFIHQQNFKKKKGDILLSVDGDGYIKKGVIKDILLYGDAKVFRTRTLTKR